jgi:hypothetical protein
MSVFLLKKSENRRANRSCGGRGRLIPVGLGRRWRKGVRR